mmetsp:Transcript_93403/g.250146  ORF Transcript_93403/g.250146 Transcript_93403/m.250146 type:complete len:94 (+) Transcript_93403:435-716(+)
MGGGGFPGLHGGFLSRSPAETPVEVCAARLQGIHANVNHFRNSAVMCDDVDPRFKPMLLEPATGAQLQFPPPEASARIRRKTLRKARALAVCA